MEIPQPSDAHARLHALAGQWGGEETVHPAPWEPAGGSATAFINNRIVLNGFAVVQEYEQYRDGKPTFSGHGLFWWDASASEYVMTWIDSMMGVPANYRGTFDGDVLRLLNTMPQGGFARCSFDCGMPGEYVFLMEVSPDGETWTPAMEGAYGRLTAPAPQARKPRKQSAPKKQTAAVKKAVPKKAVPRKVMPKKALPKKGAAKTVAKAAKKPVKASARKAAHKAAKKAARGKK